MTASCFRSPLTAPGSEPALTPTTVLCAGHAPLVLLPVRLETRFFTRADGQTELRVRVYPDKVHIDSHEPAITADEHEAATLYWQQDWRAGPDTAARLLAWRTVATRLGAARAAWLLRVLQPTNLAQRPTRATPAPEALAPAPLLPTPALATGGAWRQAPQARLLPDRWQAVVHVAGQAPLSAQGRDIKLPMAVGPNPALVTPDTDLPPGDQLAIDPGMRWMVDFDAAEACGMALRMVIPAAALSAGLDSLFVFGVATSLAAPAAAAALADMFDAHQHTDGLEFLALGTPTNNTEERRAGGDAADPDHARSFERVVLADPSRAPNAAQVGRALGLPPARIAATLGRIGQAERDHEQDARSMNTAMWPVGWGYFLSNLVGPQAGVSTAALDWARRHHRSFVRAGGPLPPLRFGSQPYGLLPVTSLKLWAPAVADPDGPHQQQLQGMLLALRDKVWRPAAAQVARIGQRQSPLDPGADLADLMRVDGVSHGLRLRGALGRHTVEHLFVLASQDFGAAALSQEAVAHRLLQRLGLATEPGRLPPLARLFFDANHRLLTAAWVQAGEQGGAQPLQPDYIGALLDSAGIQALLDARPGPGTSLLQALLRHGLLREMANAAARLVATLPGYELSALLRDAQLVDMIDAPVVDFKLAPPPSTLHWRRQLEMRVPAITGTATVRKYLESQAAVAALGTPELAALGDFRAALAHLRTLDSERLQLLLQGTLDLTSHRLDAWVTSLATQRLAAMTGAATGGVVVGGYGWVENLRPAAAAAALPAAAVPAGEAGPLQALPRDSGFIHAPSLTHAAAAALLRNAHLGPLGQAKDGGPFAIDLSSQRAREAARLLEGVRQGQPLGALLGYRLERRLHDLQLDRFIAPLRAAAPLAMSAQGSPPDTPVEALAAANVVDALVLLRRLQDPDDTSVAQALQAATAAQREQVMGELEALRAALDGLGDALTAETAYQLARGNPVRMASTLAAVAQGEPPPAELEVLRMPRSGNTITHRVLVLMAGGPQTGAGWMASNNSAAAGSERMLNAWVSRLLGDARKVRCTVERLAPGSADVLQSLSFPLAELPLTPLDFVHGVQAEGGAGPEGQSPCHVEQLVLHHAQRRAGGFGAWASLRLQHARPADLVTGETTLFDVLEQGRAVRRLLESARCVRPEDLGPAERASPATVDMAELESRVLRAETLLAAAHRRLATLVAGAGASAAEDLRTALLALGAFGLAPAVPCVAVGDTPEIRAALLKQALALLPLSQARLDRGTTLRGQAAAQARARCEQWLERGRAVFGDRFVLLPSLSVDAACATELKTALAASTQQQGGDSLEVHGWFARSARVRDGTARLAACLRGADALGAGDRLGLAVAQLPFKAGERWVGLAPLPGTELAVGKLSLVVQAAAGLNPALPMCGLLVDEWVEVVPHGEETSAIAFQFDPPNSVAPQNILIAVPPVPGQDWTTETLRLVLAETLDLAKLRAVDPSLLGAAAQYLPATLLPFNAADDAVSTDLSSLAA